MILDLAQRLDPRIPYLTAHLPGIGGVIRVQLEDFVVEEVPAYRPCGSGEHTYIWVEKRGITTTQLVAQLAEQLAIPRRTISYAGLKDAQAVARQMLSLHLVPPERLKRLTLDNARILRVSRHRNKLRIGHLRGNRFTIRIRDVAPDAALRAADILAELSARGVPNAYGPQRFGNRADNHIVGYHLLQGDRAALTQMGIRSPSRRMRQFFISALQAALFNQVVAQRIEADTLDTVVAGDIARKEDTGGLFIVEDVEAERPRAARFEISPTGPIYGYRMMEAQQEAGALEGRILSQAGLTLEDFRAVQARGVRRPLRYHPGEVTYTSDAEGVVIAFFAPKGAFATMLLRELMKAPMAAID